jgi:hypothetical protein
MELRGDVLSAQRVQTSTITRGEVEFVIELLDGGGGQEAVGEIM